ncbi:hypothetical protein I5M27_11965 [Adhaeribacter sp. BT258]|uniref:Tetratricopeptide repeat-containing protein n=1 Tax=Adhaeribacter terrigena TaxID=2793070 RepID=A0ABS1C2R5_9BACT|nr:hypothetical protein [Adhaeribacter terrigena]MBK0403706.1 hypothetical protein [Adhaeribacter terrigena]
MYKTISAFPYAFPEFMLLADVYFFHGRIENAMISAQKSMRPDCNCFFMTFPNKKRYGFSHQNSTKSQNPLNPRSKTLSFSPEKLGQKKGISVKRMLCKTNINTT